MDTQQRLMALKNQQQEVLKQYESVLAGFDATHVVQQKEELERELMRCRQALTQLEGHYERALAENRELRLSIKEQIFDEKLNILKISRKKLEVYFKKAAGDSEDRLTAFERQAKQEIGSLYKAACDNLGREEEPFRQELKALEEKLSIKIQQQRARIQAEQSGLLDKLGSHLSALEAEEVSAVTIQKRIKQNEMEMKIGLNWINKVGILLILLGVGAAAKYVHSTWFNDYMRSASFFILGGLFLIGGEWFYRKSKEVFATGLLGGGVSILYGAVFYSYFLLHVIGIYSGLGLSVLITLTTVVLSVRYHSKTICSIGLIGGYLPFFTYIFSFGLRGEAYYLAMGYLFLLNVAVLLVSFWKRWNVVNYLSMVFHIPALTFLVFGADSAWWGMLYAVLTFAIHVAAIIVYPLKYAVPIKKVDVVLLGINTFVSCLVLYGLFAKSGLADYQGALALAFCFVYLLLAELIVRKIPGERQASLLFYATSLTFAVLMVPFQFGIQWTSMGWLIESVLFIVYGLKQELPKIEKAGWTIFSLCLLSFYLGDWLHFFGRAAYYNYKFSAITLGTLLVTAAYLRDQHVRYGTFGNFIAGFSYFTIFNLWVYLVYIGNAIYDSYMPRGYHYNFYRLVLAALIHAALGYGLGRIPYLAGRGIAICQSIFYCVSILLCFVVNSSTQVIGQFAPLAAAEYGAILVLLLFNVLMFFIVRRLLLWVITGQKVNYEVYPLGVILYLLFSTTLLLTQQFHLGGGHFVANFVCLGAALASIYYGFRQNYVYTRRFGLGLAVFSTIKLFVFDLAFLDTPKKIIAYFCFGFVLLGISYLYQRLKAGMEEKYHNEKM
ncbi:MAG: DUF2339 domain-containing protein [Pelosinus sp.]|nr:DUF2339 domain-containing protein [Pelosinus sp.]